MKNLFCVNCGKKVNGCGIRCLDCHNLNQANFSTKIRLEICEKYKKGIRAHKLAKEYDTTYSTIWRTLKKFNVKTSKKTYSFNEDYFEIIDSEEKAYLLGLITADGFIVNNFNTKKKRYVVELGVCDKELPEILLKAINGNQRIYEINMSKWGGNLIYRLTLASKKMVEDLINLGVGPKKSKTQTFAECVPDNLVRHYIRGIFDGDGTVGIYKKNKKNSLQYMFGISGTEQLIKRIQQELLKIGLPKNKIRKNSGRYLFQYGGKKHLLEIKKYFYDDANFYLKRKFDKFDKIK
jgi:intein-encoded DNA endonuclease-like protein